MFCWLWNVFWCGWIRKLSVFLIAHIQIKETMQYLIHDLLKLPLQDRLVVVEKIISTLVHTDYEAELKSLVDEALTKSAA